ncbi:MAG: hypothetical protein ABW185_11675 [Sedimenticola sp.]
MTKQKLKTFSHIVSKKRKNKSIADRKLFANMILVAQSRNLDMRTVLSHPIGHLPWALATADGALRKTSKPALAKKLHSNITPVEVLPDQSACIIDGMGLMHKIKRNNHTVLEVADIALSLSMMEGKN